MGKVWWKVTGFFFLLSVLLVCGAPQEVVAGVGLGINVNIGPPPIVVSEPPEMVLVPQTQVYFVPGMEFDVFFHNGYWWSPRGERWYRSRAYNGPWQSIGRRYVPGPVIRVPRDYRTVYVRERHIPYGQWKKERSRHERGEYGDQRKRHDGGEYREREERHEREDYQERGEHGHGR